MFTVDASVWVNSFDQHEPGHTVSRDLFIRLATESLPIVVPYLLLVEVAGAISRTRQDPVQAQSFAAALSNLPNVIFVALDATLAQRALDLAAQHGLRGADAVYGAVALQMGSTLISLDKEHFTRFVGVVPVQTPADILSRLSEPQAP